MRVLWFTHLPLPAVDRRTGRPALGTGHWMDALLRGLAARGSVSLGVATAYPRLPTLDFVESGIRYFVHGQPRFQSQFGHRAVDLARCREFVERFEPDLIHVHGTERFFGLLAARRLVRQPVVVSLQGLLGAYLPTFFGALSGVEVARATRLRELLTKRGLLWEYVDWALGARQEAEILRGATAFLGRTEWDRAQVRRVRPDAPYYHVGEALRAEFEAQQWSIERRRAHSLLFTNIGSPRRGVETLLDALRMLVPRWPGVQLRLGGALRERSGYGASVQRRVREAGLAERVQFLGFLGPEALARELATAHAFVIPSYAENSPNSLCEAMRVGTPCIGSFAGGIPSLVEHDRTGLLFPPGDSALLAEQVDRIFGDDALAARLGAAARHRAMERHDRDAVVRQLLSAYESVLRGDSGRTSPP